MSRGRIEIAIQTALFTRKGTEAVLQGGMGSMFEPIHGSAPTYAGKGVANPVAAIEAGRMMEEHIGLESPAGAMHQAVRSVLAEGSVRTRDMGGTARTEEIGQAIVEKSD